MDAELPVLHVTADEGEELKLCQRKGTQPGSSSGQHENQLSL